MYISPEANPASERYAADTDRTRAALGRAITFSLMAILALGLAAAADVFGPLDAGAVAGLVMAGIGVALALAPSRIRS